MNEEILEIFDSSLARCNQTPRFLDRFYDRLLEKSPKVREKFKHTDFDRQKRALRASFQLMLLAAGDGADGPKRHLHELAVSHSRNHLDIGAEYYDYWLDSLLAVMREFDDEWSHEVEDAWEQVMGVGIKYLISHYYESSSESD